MMRVTALVNAARLVEAAGQAGGLEEVRALAERGWPGDRPLDNDSPELRAAIQIYAGLVVDGIAHGNGEVLR